MEEKKALRKDLIAQRKALTPDEVYKKSKFITDKVLALEEFNQAKAVMLYYAYQNEVLTEDLINHCLSCGKTVSLPVMKDNPDRIEAYIINRKEDCRKKEKYVILEPDPETCKQQAIQDIDLIIVPGVAFDKSGNRLGFGKGYYDKFLINKSEKTTSIGICYEFQMLDSLPITSHDVCVDRVLTA